MSHRVIFYGGLGNQLFQYAFYLYLKQKYPNHRYKVDYNFYNVRKIHSGAVAHKLMKIESEDVYRRWKIPWLYLLLFHVQRRTGFIRGENDTLYDFTNFEKYVRDINNKTVAYFGYWQSYKIVDEVKEELLSNFLQPVDADEYLLSQIDRSNSVSIHIRRGDFYSPKFSWKYGGICDVNYYHKAIGYLQELSNDNHYFVFTDDVEWVQSNIVFPNIDNVTFVSRDYKSDDYVELFYMTKCKHNIISNSSFSWWGAYLNQYNKKTVVCPTKWVNDNNSIIRVVPLSWKKL